MDLDFIEYINNWVKSEVIQGRIMIGIGILLLFAFFGILQSQNELLKGTLIPLGLLILLLIGYGSYILHSRPNHAEQSILLYQKQKTEAIEKEKIKHINDNKAGKFLMKFVYPVFMILFAILLVFIDNRYYQGMSLGFILLFLSTYIADYGFVSRSDEFLTFLNNF